MAVQQAQGQPYKYTLLFLTRYFVILEVLLHQNRFGKGLKYFGLFQIVLNMTVQFEKKNLAQAKNNFGPIEEQGFRIYQKNLKNMVSYLTSAC